MTASAAIPTPAALQVEPEPALELVGLVHQQLARLIRESTAPLPSVVWQLAYSLAEVRELDGITMAQVRRSVRLGRRLDMAEAFALLNPEFQVPVDHWDGFFPRHRAVQAASQRRELELSMGERFARMLAPAPGGEAA
jgi:hypothetical protein